MWRNKVDTITESFKGFVMADGKGKMWDRAPPPSRMVAHAIFFHASRVSSATRSLTEIVPVSSSPVGPCEDCLHASASRTPRWSRARECRSIWQAGGKWWFAQWKSHLWFSRQINHSQIVQSDSVFECDGFVRMTEHSWTLGGVGSTFSLEINVLKCNVMLSRPVKRWECRDYAQPHAYIKQITEV